jgi:hypothetical protein
MASGGGNKSSSTSSTSTQVINPALANAAQAVGTKPFEAYTGPRVAAPSTQQMAGADAIRGASSGAWKPGMDSATSFATQGAGATDISGLLAKVSQLSNPFEDTVVKNTLGDMRSELDRNLTNQRLRSSGSESGIRQLFAENEMTKSGLNAMGRTAGELRSSGFNSALQSAIGIDSADKSRALSGASTLSGITQAIDSLGKGDAANLYSLGKDDTAREQAGLDANFEEFMRKQGWDANQLAAWADAFAKATGTTSTSSSTSKQSSGIGGLLSGVGALSGFK